MKKPPTPAAGLSSTSSTNPRPGRRRAELAAKRLSADTMSIKASGSAVERRRVAEGHGVDAGGLRPRCNRHPAPADRRRALRRAGDEGSRRQRRRREASASGRRRCSTSTRCRRSSSASPACTLQSSATSSTRAWHVFTRSGTCAGRRPRDAGRAACSCRATSRRWAARPRPTSLRLARPTSSTSSGCSVSGCRRARTTCRASASTPPAGGSPLSGFDPGRRSCIRA